jgi:hypothetical protein
MSQLFLQDADRARRQAAAALEADGAALALRGRR